MPDGGVVEVVAYDSLDGLYDCCWSEGSESVLLTASGDGGVRVYDINAPPAANPLRQFKEHRHEVGEWVDGQPCAGCVM
jgi:peroxin-7